MPMFTKFGRVVAYHEGLLPLKLRPFHHVVFQSHVTNENHWISATRLPDHQTWQNGNLSWWTPAHNHLITSSCEIMWQTRTIISPISRCLSPPNLIGWWLTLSSSHPKLLDPWVTWFCKITWQTKTISPPLTQSLWPSNLAGWWLTLRDSYHYHHLTL